MSEGFAQRLKRAVARRVAMNPVRAKLDRAVASLTFDDIPASAARVGATVLEKNGVLGTYYICGGHTGGSFEGVVQQTRDDIVSLRQAGHEIGCHSFTHADVTHLSLQDRDAERSGARQAHREGQRRATSEPVGIRAEDPAAQRTHQESDGEDACGVQQLCRLIPGWEEHTGEVDAESGVGVPVVPLDQVAE